MELRKTTVIAGEGSAKTWMVGPSPTMTSKSSHADE